MLYSWASDHIPIRLDYAKRFHQVGIFYFESWWLSELDLDDIIKATWYSVQGNNMAERLVNNLRNLRLALKG